MANRKGEERVIVLKKTLEKVKAELKSAEEKIAFLSQSRLRYRAKFRAIENSIDQSMSGKIGKHRTMKYIKTLLEV